MLLGGFWELWTEPGWHFTPVCTLYSKPSCWLHLQITIQENIHLFARRFENSRTFHLKVRYVAFKGRSKSQWAEVILWLAFLQNQKHVSLHTAWHIFLLNLYFLSSQGSKAQLNQHHRARSLSGPVRASETVSRHYCDSLSFQAQSSNH